MKCTFFGLGMLDHAELYWEKFANFSQEFNLFPFNFYYLYIGTLSCWSSVRSKEVKQCVHPNKARQKERLCAHAEICTLSKFELMQHFKVFVRETFIRIQFKG